MPKQKLKVKKKNYTLFQVAKLQHIFKPLEKGAIEEKMITYGRDECSDGEVSQEWGMESKTLPLGQETRGRERTIP